MVVAAYLAGLVSALGGFLAVFGGVWWWRRLRRAQSVSEPEVLETWSPPPPPAQDGPVLNRMSMRNVPGNRRKVRGRMDRRKI